MKNKILFKILKLILKVLISGILLYLISTKINFRDVINLLLKSNSYAIVMALVFYLISVFVASWRNLILLRAVGAGLSVRENFKLYMRGLFYNFFIPGGIGGDAYRVYELKKKFRLPLKRLFLAMLFDRLSGFWAICLLLSVMVSSVFFNTNSAAFSAGLMLPLVFLVITGVYFLLMRKFFADYASCFFELHCRAILVQSLQLLSVLSILLSQDSGAKVLPYLCSFIISTLAAYIPISFSGIGTREYVMTHLARMLGLDPALAVFLTVSFFLVSAIAALTGLLFFIRKNVVDERPD